MIRINLLPPELRKKKKVPFIDRTFIYGILILVGELILLYLVSLSQQTKVAELESQIAAAQLELDKYQDKIRMLEEATQLRTELANRMSAVQELENRRAYWIQILTELTSLMPEYLWIENFQENSPGNLNIAGKGYTLKAIASFMINLIGSKIFADIALGPISQQQFGDLTGYTFTVTMNLKTAEKPVELGTFVVDTAKAAEAQNKGYKGFVESTRSKLGLVGKEEVKKMFGGVN